MSEPDYKPRRFRTNVPYYARYRLAYPPELIQRVVQTVGLSRGGRVLDLGCGPGLLAIPFAKAGMQVMGVDPEPDMLQAAREGAEAAGVAVDFRQGSSFDLPETGPLDLVTMGRSFHWMDRAETLRVLDKRLSAKGAIALFEDNHKPTAENKWLRALQEVGAKYGMLESEHHQAIIKGEFRTHISYLFESAFSHVIRVGVYVRQERTVDDIVGLAFSFSMLSHEKLGERAEPFEADFRAALLKLSPEGRFVEIAELAADIAMRP